MDANQIAATVKNSSTVTLARNRMRPLCRQHSVTQRAALEAYHAQEDLRTQRFARRRRDPLTVSVGDRLRAHLRTVANRTIRQRAVSTPTGWSGGRVIDRQIAKRLWLVHDEYNHHYSNRCGDWWTGASYLCGYEDGQYWAVRVPRTIRTVAEALDWHIPAAVRRAQDEGRQVIRQGDVWFVQLKRGKDNLDLPLGHDLRDGGYGVRVVEHAEHGRVFFEPGTAWRSYTARTVDGQAD